MIFQTDSVVEDIEYDPDFESDDSVSTDTCVPTEFSVSISK